MYLVEALVYGLAGGRKDQGEGESLDEIEQGFDFSTIRPENLPRNPQEFERVITAGDLARINRDSGGAMPVRIHDPGLPPKGVITLDMDAMRRRNAERIALRTKLRA